MMRLLYLLSLCFLLLGSYAHADELRLDHSFQQCIENPVAVTLATMPNSNGMIYAIPSGKESITDRLKATEIEEDCDSESFRKLLETGIPRITSFYALQPGSILPSLCSQRRPTLLHLSGTAADKFIVNRVIRI